MKSRVCPNLLSLDYLKYNCVTLLILPRNTLNFNGALGSEGRIQCCVTNQIKSKPEDSVLFAANFKHRLEMGAGVLR